LKEFAFPIRTTPWGSIKAPQDYEKPDLGTIASPLLSHEPTALHVAFPVLPANKAKA
jgi:adenylylsulfate reductase subunit B